MNTDNEHVKIALLKRPKPQYTPVLGNIKATFPHNESKRPIPPMENLLKALEFKNLERVIEILDDGLDVNYQEPLRAHRTPLLYAAKFNFLEALEELLERRADPNAADDSGITPLHAAASYGNLEPLKKLLEIGVNPNVKDVHGKTPLHFATQALGEDEEYNALKIVQTLLTAGASISIKDEDDKTPMHGAAFAGNTEVLSLLLSWKGDSLVFERDKDGRTPLHQAVLGARSLVSVKLLLQFNTPIDAKDNDGRTPLHYVAGRPINYVDKEFDVDCLELLLSYGASVKSKDDDGYNALSLALQRTMWWSRQSPRDTILHSVQLLVAKGAAVVDGFDMWRIVETFPSLVMVALNQSIRTNTSAKDSPHLQLLLDFRPLTVSTRLLAERKRLTYTPVAPSDEKPIPPPLLNDSEISMLHYIFWARHKAILRHPLCSAFLHLKWLKVRKFFLIHAIIYLLFVLTLTLFVLSLQFENNSENPGNHFSKSLTSGSFMFLGKRISNTDMKGGLWFLLLGFTTTFILKELLQFGHSPSIYIRHYENVIDDVILVCVLLLLFRSEREFVYWQRNTSVLAVIASWSRLMLFLGQFPSCGVYIVMFSTVLKTVFRFLMMYLPLLIAFSLGFLILLRELDSFEGVSTALISTLVMMAGEIEYEERFLNNKSSSMFACVVLVIFILLIYIILSNLLVALAVNDLNSIQQRSEILRLSRQVELMVTVESFLRSPFVPNFLRKCLQKRFSINQGNSEGIVRILPNKKPGYTERLFINLFFVFRFRSILTKIFEYFDVKFIPPDLEPSLPKSILQEAINLALTELEIEKRDKLMFSKSLQVDSLRKRAINRKQRNLVNKQIGPLSQPLSRRESFMHENIRSINWSDEFDPDLCLSSSRQQVGLIPTNPSLKASLWRASVRKEAFRNLHLSNLNTKRESDREEIESLKDTIEKLKDSVEILTSKLPSLKTNLEAECRRTTSHPIAKTNNTCISSGRSMNPLGQAESFPGSCAAYHDPRKIDFSVVLENRKDGSARSFKDKSDT